MIKKARVVTILLVGALISSVLGTAATSSAQYNILIHMGAECHALSGAIEKTSLGYVINEHAVENRVVLCPLIRDNPDVAINEVLVNVLDQNNDSNHRVRCMVTCYEDNDYTASSSGTGYQDSDNNTTNFVGYDSLTISTSDITEYNDGRCFVNCEIPDGDMSQYSAIVSYQADY
jgi:hypothetical protein